MRVALHTPLKPPDHPTPSGDRQMARALIAALRAAGCRVITLDRHRPGRPGLSSPTRQAAERREALARARAIVDRQRRLPRTHPHRFDVWVTYHCWHKKPDWIGAEVSAALGVPYAIVEASYAPKRRGKAWRLGHRAVLTAIRAADLIVHLNPVDAVCVDRERPRGAGSLLLPPFIDAAPFAAADRETSRAAVAARFGFPDDAPILLAVAMMRAGDKHASYTVLADALDRLGARDWRLLVVGHGPQEAAVRALLERFGARVAFAGPVGRDALPELYAASDVYVWPAVNEAFGMAFMEAEAAGVPVVAGRTGGVPRVVHDGVSGLLAPVGDVAAFADALARLLDDADLRARLSAGAGAVVAAEHTVAAAARRLGAALTALRRERRR